MFVKIFETEKFGQLMVLKMDSEDKPVLLIVLEPHKEISQRFSVSTNIDFDGDSYEEQKIKRDKSFDSFNQGKADAYMQNIFNIYNIGE